MGSEKFYFFVERWKRSHSSSLFNSLAFAAHQNWSVYFSFFTGGGKSLSDSDSELDSSKISQGRKLTPVDNLHIA